MSFLTDLQKCINTKAEIIGKNRNFLIEPKTNTKLSLTTSSSYLLYDFELVKPRLYPFFAETENVKGLNSIADYVIFSEFNDKLWAVVVELKNGGGNPNAQIWGTTLFIDYLVKSVNRQCSKAYKVEHRAIAHSKFKRPPTQLKLKPKHNITQAYGDVIELVNYLK